MELTLDFAPEPDWQPLERVVGPLLVHDFMHMGHIGSLQLYKHRNTRRYLTIDSANDHCFIRLNDSYSRVDVQTCVAYALDETKESLWN